jgi:NTE family protein
LWDGGLVDKAPLAALRDSAAGAELDAILVHYLPSRNSTTEPSGALAWPSGLAAGVDALRKDHFRLQVELLEARGFPVYVVESRLRPVSPREMELGPEALEGGRRAALEALHGPALRWTGLERR